MKRDLRQYARQTNARLLAGLFALVAVLGVGLIYLILGENAALASLVCLGVALIPALLVVLILFVFEKVVKRARGD